MNRMSKFFSRTHRNLSSVTLLAFLIACGGDSSNKSDDGDLTAYVEYCITSSDSMRLSIIKIRLI